MFSISSAESLSNKRAKTDFVEKDASKDVKKAASEKPKNVDVKKAGKKRRQLDEYEDDETDQSIKRHASSANGRKKKKKEQPSPANQPLIDRCFSKTPQKKTKKVEKE